MSSFLIDICLLKYSHIQIQELHISSKPEANKRIFKKLTDIVD